MKVVRALLVWQFLLLTAAVSHASSVIPLSTPDLVQASDAVFRGTVLGFSGFEDANGSIFTKTCVRVDEALKGEFPSVLQIVHRGGRMGNRDEFYGLSPRFIAGQEYLLFVNRQPDGTLHCTQGHASAFHLRRAAAQSSALLERDLALLEQVRALTDDGKLPGANVTDQGVAGGMTPSFVSGLLTNSDHQSTRFLQADRGEPIPYLIDATSYPAGLTLAQATNAVDQALAAWSAVTSLKFRFDGFQNFGTGANAVVIEDEKLRIQLHDLYDQIKSTNVLGIGGRFGVSNSVPGTTWNLGGNVAGNDFWQALRGFVVLESTNNTMNSPATFAEVLCHEVGHALSMAHSSEDPNEPNALLTQAIMYYKAHADGRGATLGEYDPPVIRQAYPSNTVPYTFNRVMDVISAPATPVVPGINELEVRGYDLQTTNLTLEVAGASSFNGTFSVVGNLIKYTPDFYFSDTARNNPDTSGPYSHKDIIYARFSDGTNASPPAFVRVISLRGDATLTSDGIPDYWMNTYFGHATPMAGDLSRAADDADGDGLTNFEEYIAGMNPVDASSAQRISAGSAGTLEVQVRPYELYEVLGSTNLVNWSLVGTPFLPMDAPIGNLTNLPSTNITVTVSNLPRGNPNQFLRVRKVP